MPTNASSDDPIDPVLLRRLYDRLIELRRTDAAATADEVLAELHPSIRGTYVSPLRQMLGEETPPSSLDLHTGDSEGDQGHLEPTRQDEWTVDLPTGFKAESVVDLPPATRPKPRPQDEAESKLPEYVGKFRVKGELGRGANGVVYLGFDEELQRNVAIKLSLVSGEKLQQRLRVEASKAAQIDAPGIVPVHHIGTTESGAVYIVQKFIEGSTLRDILKNGGPLSPARGVRLIREVAAALEPAHLLDILHRDLKPDNILVDQSGKAWISDFGLAISEEEQQGRRSELAGTPAYMSPEQIKGRIDFLDPRSDIWAMGVMFYEVLTGKLPFSGKNRKALAEQICERDPRPMQQRAPQQLSSEMNDLFNLCCAKKPSQRFASTGELLNALDDLIDNGLSEHNINGRFISTHASDSLFDYDTTSGRDSVLTKGTVSSVRTERTVAGRDTIRGTQRTDSGTQQSVNTVSTAPTRSVPLWVSASLLVLMALVAFLVLRPDNPVVPSQGVGSTPEIASQIQADGTATLPWVVASDGSGSHTTIQAAIDESDGSFIRIETIDNSESLEIRKKVTLIGAAPDKGCTIHSKRGPTITVVCPDPSQLVTLRNLTIRGLGDQKTDPFNTVDVANSSLAVIECEIESRTQNCIKGDGGAFELTDSTFQSVSNSQAVSFKGHRSAVIKGCEFYSGGVELTQGDGTFASCLFQKGNGISALGATDARKQLSIKECQFRQCFVGLTIHNQMEVSVKSGSVFDGCDRGVMMQSLDRSPVGKLTVESTDFVDCKYDAIYVAGGDLTTGLGCSIRDCQTGVFVEAGSAELIGLVVSGGSVAATLGVKPKDRIGELLIRPGTATANLVGGRLEGAKIGLSVQHTQGNCVVKGVEFADNDGAGIAFAGGQLSVVDTVFSGGACGFFGTTEGQNRLSVVVESSSFDKLSECDVKALGPIDIYLKDCQLSGNSASRLHENPPAKIHVTDSSN